MQQISIFDILKQKDRTLRNLKCNNKNQEAKKRRALKKGIDVGDIVTIDDMREEYEVHYFGWGSEEELFVCIGNRACQLNWDINSNRVHVKNKNLKRRK